MESRKSQLLSSLDQLRLEYTVIVKTLDRIMDFQTTEVDAITNTNNNDLLNNSNWFLSASTKQFVALQKFVEISMDLEKFAISFNEKSEIDHLSLNTSNMSVCDISSHKKEKSTTPLNYDQLENTADPFLESENEGCNLIEEDLNLIPVSKKIIEVKLAETSDNDNKTKKSVIEKVVVNNNHVPTIGKKGKKKRYRNRLCPPTNILIKESPVPNLHDKCFLCSFINPREIYINLKNTAKQLDEITKEIKKVYSNGLTKFKTKEDFQRVVDKYSVYYSEEYKSWHRVEILDWMIEENTPNVKIKYIDYGLYCVASFKDMQLLPEFLYRIPKLAIQCDLAYLYPPESTADNKTKEWSQKSIDAMNKYIDENNIEYEIVYLVHNSDNTISVDLRNEDSSEKTLGDFLMNNGLVVEITPFNLPTPTNSAKNSEMDENAVRDQILDDYFENMDFSEEVDTLGEAIAGYDAQDEARICKFRTKCRKIHCQLEHKDLRMDGYTTDKHATYTSPYNVPDLSVGDKIEIVITHVDNINRFYVQLRACDSTLRQLLNLMNRPASVASYKPLKLLPASGEIILAKNWEDKWLRAMVKDVDSSATTSEVLIHVFFVDFGDEMMVPIKHCRVMDDRYMNTTFKAVQCYLHNIKVPNDKTLDETKEYFESRYLSAPLIAEVKYIGYNYMDLKVYDTDGTDISTVIIEDGFGVYYKTIRPKMNVNQLLVD